MSKVAHYLQQHITGEVTSAASVRSYFSTDSSVLSMTPMMVVYPRGVNDIRKVARFSWQLSEKGKQLPITPRGKGTDMSGAAIGSGISLVFPAHLKNILEFDTIKGRIKVEPGVNYHSLQQTLNTHGWHLPSFPASADYSTIGGAVAKNSSGEKSYKYGPMKNFVESLEVVLSNGEVITTERLNKKGLEKKKGLTTFEGDIYRKIDAIIDENQDFIANSRLDGVRNIAGYDIASVKQDNGSFDLTPLIVGSQGTLGIINTVSLRTEKYYESKTLVMAKFKDLHQAEQASIELADSEPALIEMIDINLLNFIEEKNPMQLASILDKPYPKALLLIEYDESDRKQKTSVKKAKKTLEEYSYEFSITQERDEQDVLSKLRQSSASIMWHSQGGKRFVPIINDGAVPKNKTRTLINGVYKLFDKYNMPVAVWGHMGDSSIQVYPLLDISKVGDRQKVFKIMDDYYAMILKLGGSVSSDFGDGRLRAQYLKKMYGDDMHDLLKTIKDTFDPHNILNPGVKFGTSQGELKNLLRKEYSINHIFDHMPAI